MEKNQTHFSLLGTSSVFPHSELAGNHGVPIRCLGTDHGRVFMGGVCVCVCVLQHSELAGDCGVPVRHGGHGGGMVLMGDVYVCVAAS